MHAVDTGRRRQLLFFLYSVWFAKGCTTFQFHLEKTVDRLVLLPQFLLQPRGQYHLQIGLLQFFVGVGGHLRKWQKELDLNKILEVSPPPDGQILTFIHQRSPSMCDLPRRNWGFVGKLVEVEVLTAYISNHPARLNQMLPGHPRKPLKCSFSSWNFHTRFVKDAGGALEQIYFS